MSLAEKPLVVFGTMNPRMPDASPSSRVCAQTIATSAMDPLVIHIFVPLRIQSSPSRRANVRIPPGLLPKSGSVRPKHPIVSPRAMDGSHWFFCSSLPQR